ncbi:MAG: GTP-binding protein [Geminicoccaceae bacterium]
MTPYARIVYSERCGVPLDTMLGQNAFDLKRVLEIEPHFLEDDHAHEHDDDVTSVSLHADSALDPKKFQEWFGRLLQERGQDILRSKGILDIACEADRYVIQGVHMLMEGNLMGPWPEHEARKSQLVFIGRGLDGMGLEEGFAACKAA